MKSNIILSILLIFFASCRSSTNADGKLITKENELTVTPIFKGCYFLEKHREDGMFFLFDIVLTNNTKTSLEFWTLTAAPIVNIVIDPDKLDFFIPSFSTNSPVIIKLDHGQEFVVPVILNRNDTTRLNSLRFGFIISKPKYKGGFHKELDIKIDPKDELFEMRNEKKNVIWSKTTEIHPLMNQFRYQIRTIVNDSTYSIVPRERLFK
jgi:hypothetical protein